LATARRGDRRDGRWLMMRPLATAMLFMVACWVAVSPGCAWFGFAELLPETSAGHKCACDNIEGSVMLYRCNADGRSDARGAYGCCYTCRSRCGAWPGIDATPAAPVYKPPVPLPPVCDAHCKTKESCVIGDHTCCATCHQACL
jgi:hypothetical protein